MKRSPRTTYEGSHEESADVVFGRCGGFDRSSFVREQKGSGFELREKYCIGEELGSGATSTVYRSVNKRTGEAVAVKIINKAHVQDTPMLQNEIRIHKATDHPNVLRLLEVFEDDCYLYLITELCGGGDVWKMLNAKHDEYSALAMPEEDALQLIQQVVNSVLYLHMRGIVHRDLKPSNFLCATSSSSAGSEPHIIKLADFGVSAYCSEKHRLTRKVGTDGFMAPEILRNQPYNEKADIFSIGCILHMMLTGHPPKSKECGRYTTAKIRLKFVSKELRELVLQCMQLNPDDRPSAQEIINMPLLKRVREKAWVNSARLDAQLLDNMYAYSSFPLLKKAALVAMVSRAESDDKFASCIKKFMSLESSTSGITAEDVYSALDVEMVEDMEKEAQHFLHELPSSFQTSSACSSAPAPSKRRGVRSRRRPAPLITGPAVEGRELFRKELYLIAEDLVHKIDVGDAKEISYSEWLAATADASWYTDRQRIEATFKLLDCDGDGVISKEDLQRVIPNVFNKVDVQDVLLESQHRLARGSSGMNEKDFVILLQTHKPSNYTLKRIRAGFEDPLLPSVRTSSVLDSPISAL